MSAVTLREVCALDIDNVAALWLSNWQSTYRGLLPDDFLNSLQFEDGCANWTKYISVPENRIYAAFDGDGFLGFAACEPDCELRDCLYLHSLHVAEQVRGRGVGTQLISRVWQRAVELRCSGLSICVVRGNEKARRLYVCLGAEHYKYFTDSSDGVQCQSEKLIWTEAPRWR